MTDTQITLTVIGALIGAAFTLWAAVLTSKQKTQESLIDDLGARVERLERQNAVQANYIADLRGHIYEQKGPPPPPFPEGMIR